MSDDRGRGTEGVDDGLDAWLAANFPPRQEAAPPEGVKPEEAKPEPAPEPTPVFEPASVPEPAAVPEPTPVPEPAPVPEPTPEPVLPPVESPMPWPPLTDAALPGPQEPGPQEPGWQQSVPQGSGPQEPSPAANPTETLGPAGNASDLDDLFGETRFREYDAGPDRSENPFVARPVTVATSGGDGPRAPAGGISRTQRVLLWVAGSLVAVLALLVLFLVGTRLPGFLGPAPAIVAPSSASPSPSPTVMAVGPVTPGDYRWDELLGGECLDPYTGPWAEDFTVVDCTLPHPAQLVVRGTFAEQPATVPGPSASPGSESGSGYPGIAALQAQINLLCTAATVIDYAAAGAYTDIQFEASYPVSDEQWQAGDRDYFCFVSRASGAPLAASIAIAPVAPSAPPAP